MPTEMWDAGAKAGIGIAALFVVWSLGTKFLDGWQAAEMHRYEIESIERQALQQLAAAATQASVSSRELMEQVKRMTDTYTGVSE